MIIFEKSSPGSGKILKWLPEWHFRASKFQTFLEEHAPRPPWWLAPPAFFFLASPRTRFPATAMQNHSVCRVLVLRWGWSKDRHAAWTPWFTRQTRWKQGKDSLSLISDRFQLRRKIFDRGDLAWASQPSLIGWSSRCYGQHGCDR